MATYKVEKISNGLIVTTEDGKTYFPTFEVMMDAFTQELKERYEETKRHEWDGQFSVTVNAEGLV